MNKSLFDLYQDNTFLANWIFMYYSCYKKKNIVKITNGNIPNICDSDVKIFQKCQWQYDIRSSTFLVYGISREIGYIGHQSYNWIDKDKYASYENIKFIDKTVRCGFLFTKKKTVVDYEDGYYLKTMTETPGYVTKVYNGLFEIEIT